MKIYNYIFTILELLFLSKKNCFNDLIFFEKWKFIYNFVIKILTQKNTIKS
jgi:hypothetical protein